MQKQKSARKDSARRARKDATDTYGVRGAGATGQADFGMAVDWDDFLFSVKREPVANRVVFTVAHDIFDKGFKIEEIAEKPDRNWSRDVAKVLDGLNAKAALTQAVIFERLFGWSIIALTYVDRGEDISKPVIGPKEIREILPYSVLQVSVQTNDEDKDKKSGRFGLPIYYTVKQGTVAQQVKLHYSRAIHCATRLLEHPFKGMSVLEPIYDDLTVWRNERWGLGQTMFRYGSGFPDIMVAGAKKKDLDDLEASQQFANLQARTYFMHGDNTTLEFKGLAGRALDPEPYTTPVIESLSCGTGIPTAILRGAQAGALTGSEVNEREYFKFISAQQTLYEPMIWELIDKLMETGQIRPVDDYKVVWLSGIELSEKDKAAVELQKAQTLALKVAWLTIDEVRAEDNKGPLPDGAGQVVLGIKKAEQQPFQQGSGAVSQGDMSLLARFVSKLRRKKDENDSNKQS